MLSTPWAQNSLSRRLTTDRAVQKSNSITTTLSESFPISIRAADSFQNTSRNDINC
jgi:hypothetical protein